MGAILIMSTEPPNPNPSPLNPFLKSECTQESVGVLVNMHLLLLLLSDFSRVRLHRRQPTRLRCPWDSPGKNTGVGCHFLLQCMKVKSESEVAQLCPTLSDPMDCSLPGSSVHGIFQARVLEWGAIAFSEHATIKSLIMQARGWSPETCRLNSLLSR